MKKIIIFTDLDGTLLDAEKYSFESALPALSIINEKVIPLIICSSKTKSEIEFYRKKLHNLHPFITENGGGIFIPENYFDFDISKFDLKPEKINKYFLIRLGEKYSNLRKGINKLKRKGLRIKGFGDMTVKEIAEITKLSLKEAKMAKKRDFDEPFIFQGDKKDNEILFNSIKKMNFNVTMGRFFHLIGNSDKGKAVSILIKLFKEKFSDIITIALGDSPNDSPMLEKVDYPIIVQKNNGNYDPNIKVKNIIRANGIGPLGWNNAIMKILRSL